MPDDRAPDFSASLTASPMNFSTVFLMGRAPSVLLNSTPDKELECLVGDGEIETTLTEPCYFLGNGKVADFTLDFRRERLEDDFLVEASNKLRAKEAVELRDHRSFECGEWQPGRAKKLL